MEQEFNNEYVVELEKLMPSQISMTQWSKNMDLFAIATFDQYLQLFRISFKAQLVFQEEESTAIACIAFSSDSHLIAYGLADSTIKILKTENGQKVTIVESLHKSPIENLTFADFHKLEPKQFMPFQKTSLESKLILPVSPHRNCNKNAIIKINYFNNLTDQFVFLLSSQKSKTIFLLNGFIPIAEIDYKSVAQKLKNNFRVHFSHYDQGCFRSIISEQNDGNFVLHLVEYEKADILHEYHEDIIKFHCILGYVSQLLNFVQGTFPIMEVLLREITSNYSSQMGEIDDNSVENINPCEELFRFLNLGVTSAPLVNFFSKSFYDSKLPQKLDESLTSSFAKLHDLILESMQNSLERATILLNRLKDMSNSKRFVEIFGISEQEINAILSAINKIYTMSEILLVESTQTKFDIRNLLVWLNKSAIKTSQENDIEIENTKSYLNKYTVDYNRLYKFLQKESRFNLQHLRAFFNKTDESRGIDIESPEFRLLHRKAQAQSRDSPELLENFRHMEKLLGVQDIIVPEQQEANSFSSFKSFKKEMAVCKDIWKSLKDKPIRNISSLITRQHSITKIGTVEFNQLFLMQVEPSFEEGELIIYYVEREEALDFDKLVRFNCFKRQKKWVRSSPNHNIQSLTVGESVLVVLEEKLSGKRIVAQVSNKDYDGSEIQIGQRISRISGEVDINCGMRGLNSLIENKTKLIIFQQSSE